jgi:hypothetical protein
MFYLGKRRPSKKNERNNLKIWEKNKGNINGLCLPGALEKRYPDAGKEWALRGGFHVE